MCRVDDGDVNVGDSDGCDGVGDKKFLTFELNFFWSIKLFEVIFHFIEQDKRFHRFVQSLNLFWFT